MRWLGIILGLCLGLFAFGASAGTYAFIDGTHITGEPSSYQQTGIEFKQGETYTPLIPWAKFTEDSLKQLLSDATTPTERSIVEPMILQLPVKHNKPADFTVKPVELPPRPTGQLGVLAIFTSAPGWFILLVLYGANIFAAYEVAIFRNRPIPTVCGLAAIPLFGLVSPIYFIAMPGREFAPVEEAPRPAEAARFATTPVPSRMPGAAIPPPAAPVEEFTSAGTTASTTSALPQPVIYRRGEFVFNRRFFETKLTAYTRVMLGDAEKNTVIVINSSRGKFTGRRISKITPSELFLQTFKEGATADEMIPFLEIMEVQIRHQDPA